MTAQERGWGPGWPNCQTHRQENLSWVTGKVIADAHELIDTLCAATERRGYHIHADKSWGFACRSIRGSSSASNHSWGLAVDINAPSNPMTSRLVTDMPSWMPRMWEDCGFRWGGRYRNRPDAMHYEYMGRPKDVARHLEKAKRYLAEAGGNSTEPEEDPLSGIKPENRALLDKMADDMRRDGIEPGSVSFITRAFRAARRHLHAHRDDFDPRDADQVGVAWADRANAGDRVRAVAHEKNFGLAELIGKAADLVRRSE